MSTKRTSKEIVDALRTYHGQYKPESHFIQELCLLHSSLLPNGGGGEFPLNNANTKRLVGVSDFQGEQINPDATGLIRAVVIRYGELTRADGVTVAPTPAIIDFKETRASFPTWLLNSELVLKSSAKEEFRIRVSELVPSAAPESVPSEWAKEFEKTIRVEGNQSLTVYLNTPEGAFDPSATKDEYIQVNLYGVKFAARKNN